MFLYTYKYFSTLTLSILSNFSVRRHFFLIHITDKAPHVVLENVDAMCALILQFMKMRIFWCMWKLRFKWVVNYLSIHQFIEKMNCEKKKDFTPSMLTLHHIPFFITNLISYFIRKCKSKLLQSITELFRGRIVCHIRIIRKFNLPWKLTKTVGWNPSKKRVISSI